MRIARSQPTSQLVDLAGSRTAQPLVTVTSVPLLTSTPACVLDELLQVVQEPLVDSNNRVVRRGSLLFWIKFPRRTFPDCLPYHTVFDLVRSLVTRYLRIIKQDASPAFVEDAYHWIHGVLLSSAPFAYEQRTLGGHLNELREAIVTAEHPDIEQARGHILSSMRTLERQQGWVTGFALGSLMHNNYNSRGDLLRELEVEFTHCYLVAMGEIGRLSLLVDRLKAALEYHFKALAEPTHDSVEACLEFLTEFNVNLELDHLVEPFLSVFEPFRMRVPHYLRRLDGWLSSDVHGHNEHAAVNLIRKDFGERIEALGRLWNLGLFEFCRLALTVMHETGLVIPDDDLRRVRLHLYLGEEQIHPDKLSAPSRRLEIEQVPDLLVRLDHQTKKLAAL